MEPTELRGERQAHTGQGDSRRLVAMPNARARGCLHCPSNHGTWPQGPRPRQSCRLRGLERRRIHEDLTSLWQPCQRGRARVGGCRPGRRAQAFAGSQGGGHEAAQRQAAPPARRGWGVEQEPGRRVGRRPKMPRALVRKSARWSVPSQRGARGARQRQVAPPVSHDRRREKGPRRLVPPRETARQWGGGQGKRQQLDRPQGRELNRLLDRGHAREQAAPMVRRRSRRSETLQVGEQETNGSNADLDPRTCRKQGGRAR